MKVPGYTWHVAEFVEQARVEEFPRDAVERVKLHLLDAVGIMLGAYATKHTILEGVIHQRADRPGRRGDGSADLRAAGGLLLRGRHCLAA